MRSVFRKSQLGLTLLELVVVLVILAALAALIVPRLNGVASQANSATNAAVVDEVNRAVILSETRYGTYTSGWDSLLDNTDATITTLNPNIQVGTATDVMKPTIQVTPLDAGQAKSLKDAGIAGFHDADPARVTSPSDNSTTWRNINSGRNVAMLVKTPIASGHGSTFIDNAFSIDQFKNNWNHEFVVVGLGGPTGLKGSTLTEVPLIQSANPSQYYARVMCVFMVPAAGATNTFPAQYVGCFLPDGTSMRQNVDKFNSAQVKAN